MIKGQRTIISLNKVLDTLAVGDVDNLTTTISPDNATNQAITWISSNNTIVTAVSAGTVSITATIDGKTDTCIVVVNISGQSIYINANNTIAQNTTITGDLVIAPNIRLTVNSGIKLIVNGNIYDYGSFDNYGVLNVSNTLYRGIYNNSLYEGALWSGDFINYGSSNVQ